MAVPPAKITKASKSNNMQLSTLLSWKVEDSFKVNIIIVEIESRRTVNEIYCKSSRKHGV